MDTKIHRIIDTVLTLLLNTVKALLTVCKALFLLFVELTPNAEEIQKQSDRGDKPIDPNDPAHSEYLFYNPEANHNDFSKN